MVRQRTALKRSGLGARPMGVISVLRIPRKRSNRLTQQPSSIRSLHVPVVRTRPSVTRRPPMGRRRCARSKLTRRLLEMACEDHQTGHYRIGMSPRQLSGPVGSGGSLRVSIARRTYSAMQPGGITHVRLQGTYRGAHSRYEVRRRAALSSDEQSRKAHWQSACGEVE